MSFKISVVIPVKNEMSYGYIKPILNSFANTSFIEPLWVLSESHDGTHEFLLNQKQKVIFCSKNSRAARLNLGISQASSDFVLLHHPRSLLAKKAFHQLRDHFRAQPRTWGGFTHQFQENPYRLLDFTSFYSNRVRFDRAGIIYLDHCIFFNKALLPEGPPMAEVDIFEDTLFSQALLKNQRPKRLSETSVTSSVRFETNGVWRQAIMNQALKLGFHFSLSHQKMNKLYEKGLNLNSSYN